LVKNAIRRASHQLRQNLEAFCRQQRGENGNAGEVPFRLRQVADQAGGDRIDTGHEHDRDRRGRLHRRADCRHGPGNDHIDLAGDEFGRQCRESVILALGKQVFDRDVSPFDIAGVAQSLADLAQARPLLLGRVRAEITDDRHRLLLRMGRQRPRDRRPSKDGDKIAPTGHAASWKISRPISMRRISEVPAPATIARVVPRAGAADR
jgi:hypothetical protein